MTYRSADFQSAVSQNCILLAWKIPAPRQFGNPADCKSAIRQIENLRYVTGPARAWTKAMSRLWCDSAHWKSALRRRLGNLGLCGLLLLIGAVSARGEAMLELFQVSWSDLIQKMPEIAEAGYTSLWLPPPAKGGSVFSVGYDLFDPFDARDTDQRGTTAT